MAEETNVKRRLEQRLAEYQKLRKKQRGKAALAFMGVDTEPSIDQMAAYNASLLPFVKELMGLQTKIYASESERRKERAATLRNFMTNARALVNNKATNATGAMKARLQARSRNIDAYIRGLDLTQKDTTGVTDPRVNDKKFSDVIYTAQDKALRKQNYDPREAGRYIAKNLRDPQQRQAALDELKAIAARNQQENTLGIKDEDVRQMEDAIKTSQSGIVQLTDDEQELAGVIPGTLPPEEMNWMAIGRQSVINPDEVSAAFAVEQTVIDATHASNGGGFAAALAEVVRGATSGSTEDVHEALNDFIGELGFNEDESSSLNAAETQRELLLGQLYNPNAPAAVELARDALLQDPGFLKYKQSMGFYTDRAAVRGLKRQLRQERKRRKKNDRKVLRQTRFGITPQALDAMKVLQENEDRTKRLADDAIASKSATLAQPSAPESTVTKTGGPSGGAQNNPFYSGS